MGPFGTKKSLKNIQEAQAETLEAVYKLSAKTPEEKKAIDKAIKNGKHLKRSVKKLNKLQDRKEKQERKDARALKKNKKKLAKIEKKNAKKKDELFTKQEHKINDKLQAAKNSNADVSELNVDKKKGVLDKIRDKAENSASEIGPAGLGGNAMPTSDASGETQSAGGGESEPAAEAMTATGEAVANVSEKQDNINKNTVETTASINQLTQNKLNVIREDTEDIKEAVTELRMENADADKQQEMLETFKDDLDHVSESTDALMDNSTNAAEADKKKNKSLIARLNELHANLLDKVEQKATAFYKIIYGIQFFFSHDFWELVKGTFEAVWENAKQWISDKIDSLFHGKKKGTAKQDDIISDKTGRYTQKDKMNAYKDKLNNLINDNTVEWSKKLRELQDSDKWQSLNAKERQAEMDKINEIYQAQADELMSQYDEYKKAMKEGNVDIDLLNLSGSDLEKAKAEKLKSINQLVSDFKKMNEDQRNSLKIIDVFHNPSFLKNLFTTIKPGQLGQFETRIGSDPNTVKKTLDKLFSYIPEQNRLAYLRMAYKIAPNDVTKQWVASKLLDMSSGFLSTNKDLISELVGENSNGLLFDKSGVLDIDSVLSNEGIAEHLAQISDIKIKTEAKAKKKAAKKADISNQVNELEAELNSYKATADDIYSEVSDLNSKFDSTTKEMKIDYEAEMNRKYEKLDNNPTKVIEKHTETHTVDKPQILNNNTVIIDKNKNMNFGEWDFQ